jgi:hypothetical protein
MARKGVERRVKVWHWCGRDVVSLHDLEFMVALPSRKELHAATTRLRLPKARDAGAIDAGDPDHELAMQNQGRVFWRDPEVTSTWQSEDDIPQMRAEATALRSHQGRMSLPLHRPDNTRESS